MLRAGAHGQGYNWILRNLQPRGFFEKSFHSLYRGNPELSAKIGSGEEIGVSPGVIDENGEDYLAAWDGLLNTPGCFELYHNIFGYR